MAQGISIQLTHTGKSLGPIFIDDVYDGHERSSLHRKPGPVYVPYLQSVELVYSGLVGMSFESGGIRQFIIRGELTASFVINGLVLDALDGDHLTIDFVPTNYIRDASIPEADSVTDLAAHLKGIDTALAAGGFGGSPSTIQLNRDTKVPSASVLYLDNGNVTTSSAPMVFRKAGTLTGGSIAVNTADGARTYTLRVLINGVVQENLVLPSGSTKAFTSTFTTVVAAGDELSAYLQRTGGPGGASAFNRISVLLFFTEA